MNGIECIPDACFYLGPDTDFLSSIIDIICSFFVVLTQIGQGESNELEFSQYI